MISPYTPPASTFIDETMSEGPLRWRGAIYFAFIPTMFMILMQGSVIYDNWPGPIVWHLKLLEPLLYCSPLCLFMGATGYAVAPRCLTKIFASAVWVGCAVGVGWALVAIIVGNAIAQLNGATTMTVERVIRMLIVFPAILVPLAAVLCIFTRWRGIRLGFVNSSRRSGAHAPKSRVL